MIHDPTAPHSGSQCLCSTGWLVHRVYGRRQHYGTYAEEAVRFLFPDLENVRKSPAKRLCLSQDEWNK